MYSSQQSIDEPLLEEIRAMEESLWKSETRFNKDLMEEIFAPDFIEFGRSGRIYSRSELIFDSEDYYEIKATLPLLDFQARYITDEVIQTTYVSEISFEDGLLRGNRSSIWSKIGNIWRLRFHQGTPIEK